MSTSPDVFSRTRAADELDTAVEILIALQAMARSDFSERDGVAFARVVRLGVESVGACVERNQSLLGQCRGFFLDVPPQSPPRVAGTDAAVGSGYSDEGLS